MVGYSIPDGTARSTKIPSFFALGIIMDDYFAYLLELASRLCHHILQFIEDIFSSDAERISKVSQAPNCEFLEKCSSKIQRSSQEDNLVSSSTSADIYHSESKKKSFSHERNYGIVGSRNNSCLIHQLFFFPLSGLRVGGGLVFTCFKCFYTHLRQFFIQLRGFISRVKRTLQGSAGDIGWLQRAEQLPPVEDGTTRFTELLHDVRNGLHRLPNNLVYLLIPGLFSNHGPMYFVNTKRCFSRMGLTCHIAKIPSEASVEQNSWELKQYIEELYWGSGNRVMLLGHSKGGVDAAAALSMYWADLQNKVAGLALVQSPYGGSPFASDILREGQVAHREARKIMEFLICKIVKGDIKSLEDLTYEKRKNFIAKYRLPAEQIPLVSFHTKARVAPGVLAAMSHIAHAEFPWLPLPRFLFMNDEFRSGNFGWKVPVVIPVGAALAACALHLKLRYGEESDGLVTRRDAEVPGSVVVRLERKLDHAWMVYPLRNKDRLEAEAGDVCEALLTMLVEIGRKKEGDQ